MKIPLKPKRSLKSYSCLCIRMPVSLRTRKRQSTLMRLTHHPPESAAALVLQVLLHFGRRLDDNLVSLYHPVHALREADLVVLRQLVGVARNAGGVGLRKYFTNQHSKPVTAIADRDEAKQHLVLQRGELDVLQQVCNRNERPRHIARKEEALLHTTFVMKLLNDLMERQGR